jgi:hypothetical protein
MRKSRPSAFSPILGRGQPYYPRLQRPSPLVRPAPLPVSAAPAAAPSSSPPPEPHAARPPRHLMGRLILGLLRLPWRLAAGLLVLLYGLLGRAAIWYRFAAPKKRVLATALTAAAAFVAWRLL